MNADLRVFHHGPRTEGQAGQAASTATSAARLLFVDNLRWLMIALVVTMHAAVTYSGLGSWYYKEPQHLGVLSFVIFAFYQSHLQAFFMGLLFLIAGYFVPGSFERKGARRFMADRAIRLGLPTLLYALVIHPAIVYYLLIPSRTLASPSEVLHQYVFSLDFLSGTGPLWFALALLIFTGIYALGRWVSRSSGHRQPGARLPSHAATTVLIVAIALCTFLVRVAQPIGRAVLNMQLCYFSQYIILFAVGIVACRRNWLMRLPRQFGLCWLRLAVMGGPLLWLIVLGTIFNFGRATDAKTFSSVEGGWHWQSAVFCLWESFFCVGFCLGLLVIFRDHFNRQGPLTRRLSENAFAVYVFHAPILIALSLAIRGLLVAPLLKFLLLSGASLVVCFLASHYILRRLPGLQRIL